MKALLFLAAASAATAIAMAAAQATQSAPSTPTNAAVARVKGKVRFSGERPERKPLAIDAAQATGCCPAGKNVDTVDPTLLIADDGGLANCVITIDVPGAKVEALKEPVTLDQHLCQFEPHVLIVPLGSKVVFLNSDQVSHNVHTYSVKNDPKNQTVAPGGKYELLLESGERIQVKCDMHPWMSSTIIVTESPFTALTKADGSFEISGLKPGTYPVQCWQERLPKIKAEITVREDGTSDLLELKMEEKKKKPG